MTSPIRLLYSFPHVLDRPGIAYTAYNQILGLARLGLRIELFCASIGSARLPSNVTVHQTLAIGIQRVPHRAVGVARAYFIHDMLVARWVRRNSRRIDLAHVWPQACIATLRAGRVAGIPVLRESPNPHTASVMRESAKAIIDAGVGLPHNHSHATNASRLALERDEYSIATAILVPSDYAYSAFLTEGVDPSVLLQHRYGCDLLRFPARTEVRSRADPLRVLFLGRGDPTKGLHVGLRAWRLANLPNASLTIAGHIQPKYAATMAADLSLPNVKVTGFVADVPDLLTSSDILILPTWTEGSALVTLEAQASGCVPLISSAAGPLGVRDVDFVEHPVGNAKVLAEQLVDLAEHPAKLAALSANGTHRREFLSWDTASSVLLDCYTAVLRPPGCDDGG